MTNNCILKLENGRTISIADDLNSFSVSAYKTGDRGCFSNFHVFGDGHLDRRCHSMDELVDTLKELSE